MVTLSLSRIYRLCLSEVLICMELCVIFYMVKYVCVYIYKKASTSVLCIDKKILKFLLTPFVSKFLYAHLSLFLFFFIIKWRSSDES